MKNQVFGIAVTELTALLSRRSLYGSKSANGKYSMCEDFRNEDGNILYERQDHTWDASGKRCLICGATRGVYDRGDSSETYAYQFIHDDTFVEKNKMKFDVIVGNPPYQLSDGGNAASAVPIYHKFVEQAIKLMPRFLTMIIPSRWFAGGRGLDEFREIMLNDDRIQHLVDYPKSSECFPGVEVKGGVCYFLWAKDTRGPCRITTIRNNSISASRRNLLEPGCNFFIRYNESLSIFNKVKQFNETPFSSIVSSQKPFGLRTYVLGEKEPFSNSIKLYANKSVGYIDRNMIEINKEWIKKYKVFITMAYGAGEDFPHQIINMPVLGEPDSCCTETYLVIGPFDNKQITENVISYMKTKFFRFFVMLLKNTQHAAKKVYSIVPMQDFSQPWTDEMLYKKYNISEEEIAFIDSMIRPMD